METFVFPYTAPIDIETWIVVDSLPPVEERHLWTLLDIDCGLRIQCKRLVESVSRENRKTPALIYDSVEFTKWALTSFQLKLREIALVPVTAADTVSYFEIEEEILTTLTKKGACFVDNLAEFYFCRPLPEGNGLIDIAGGFSVWCNQSESHPSLIFCKNRSSVISAVWGLDYLVVGNINLKVELKYRSPNTMPFHDLINRLFKSSQKIESGRKETFQKSSDPAVYSYSERDVNSLEENLTNPSDRDKIVIPVDGLPKVVAERDTDCKMKLLETSSSEVVEQQCRIPGEISDKSANSVGNKLRLPPKIIRDLQTKERSDNSHNMNKVLKVKDGNRHYFQFLRQNFDHTHNYDSHNKDNSSPSTERVGTSEVSSSCTEVKQC